MALSKKLPFTVIILAVFLTALLLMVSSDAAATEAGHKLGRKLFQEIEPRGYGDYPISYTTPSGGNPRPGPP